MSPRRLSTTFTRYPTRLGRDHERYECHEPSPWSHASSRNTLITHVLHCYAFLCIAIHEFRKRVPSCLEYSDVGKSMTMKSTKYFQSIWITLNVTMMNLSRKSVTDGLCDVLSPARKLPMGLNVFTGCEPRSTPWWNHSRILAATSELQLL